MATYTSNYAWTKPSGNDQVDISVLNDNLDSQDAIMHKAFTNMAQAFSQLSTYAVGDIVLYDNELYKCHTAVTTPGSWTGSANWQVYKLSEGGGGGLTLGETSSTAYRGDRGKAAYDHSQTTGNPHNTTKSDVGLSNVPNVSTNDQEPTFTEASTRNNIASGEKLSVILGKVQKFFNDLKTVAFSGSFADLSNKPSINSNELSGNKTSAQLGLQNASTEVTWAQWIQKTPQEQETGDWRITDCPWADGTVSIDLMTKLWENPDTIHSFGEQDINLSSGDYDLLLVIAKFHTTVNRDISMIVAKGANVYLNCSGYPVSNAIFTIYRTIAYVSDTKLRAYPGNITGTEDNNRLIPYQIYGIKLTASVKINAIAMDVKASIEYSTSEHLIGKWIDGSDLYERTYDFGAGANNTRKGVTSGLSNVTIRELKAWGNSHLYGFGSVYIDSSDNDAFYYDYSNNYITQYANHNLSSVSYYVTLRYTKNN